jgi:hypothetical protein
MLSMCAVRPSHAVASGYSRVFAKLRISSVR